MAWLEVNGAAALLTYCMNVHPGESLEELLRTLDGPVTRVKRAACAERPMGLGLWLAAGLARHLAADRGARAELRRRLERQDLFVFTMNAFPYGGFHAQRVKEAVFAPSWAEGDRLDYTRTCAELLAELLPAGVRGSISTVPLGHAAAGFAAADRARARDQLVEMARALEALEHRCGADITLGLEPEPGAALASVADGVQFLADEVHPVGGAAARRHIGLCVDACHEAVMFEDPQRAVRALVERRVRVAKLQVTAALRIVGSADRRAAVRAAERLAAFDEGRYFHQVAVRGRRGVTHFPDLPHFLRAARRARGAPFDEARAHFHVPVFAEPDGELGTTRPHLERLLGLVTEARLTDHFEVETYTFDVIPAAERARLGATELEAALGRELGWARTRLAAVRQD